MQYMTCLAHELGAAGGEAWVAIPLSVLAEARRTYKAIMPHVLAAVDEQEYLGVEMWCDGGYHLSDDTPPIEDPRESAEGGFCPPEEIMDQGIIELDEPPEEPEDFITKGWAMRLVKGGVYFRFHVKYTDAEWEINDAIDFTDELDTVLAEHRLISGKET